MSIERAETSKVVQGVVTDIKDELESRDIYEEEVVVYLNSEYSADGITVNYGFETVDIYELDKEYQNSITVNPNPGDEVETIEEWEETIREDLKDANEIAGSILGSGETDDRAAEFLE